jgi:uncharacterized membrane protein YqjE
MMIGEKETSRGGNGSRGYATTTQTGTVSDKSFTELIRGVITNLQDMIRAEVRLAKTEVQEEMTKAAAGARSLGVAAVLGLFAAAFVLTAVCLFLALFMPAWAAALTVGVVLGIAGLVMFKSGRKTLKDVSPKPEKTIASVKENVAWLKNQSR